MTGRILPVGIFVILLRETLEADPLYSDIWLEGDVSDLSRSAAGHSYFTLRDDDGSLKCALFRGDALRQQHPLRLGEKVAVHGGLTIYPRSGAMQLVVNLVRPAGMGLATLELERLRQKLEAEGLFAPERKRPLPPWPRRIGVVTSAHGAAWQDIQSVVSRRYPFVELVLSPALVQGLGAPQSIVSALEALDREDALDMVVVTRGGGANDDLAAFNDESVARAVYACKVPIVAGIGHAPDRTLVEDVADAFAPTPSAAAEISVPSRSELAGALGALHMRMASSVASAQQQASLELSAMDRRMQSASPRNAVSAARLRLQAEQAALGSTLRKGLLDRRQSLVNAERLLQTLDPDAILRRGYAVLTLTDSGNPLRSAADVAPGDRLSVSLNAGTLSVRVERTTQSTA